MASSRIHWCEPSQPGQRPRTYGLGARSSMCAHNPSDAFATLEEAEGLFARWDDHWERHGFG